MAAYLLVDCKVTDASRYEEYKRLAPPAIARYGGRYLSKQRLMYWRYRAFATLPGPIQMWFRRLRNSDKDWAILKGAAARQRREPSL